MDLFANLAQVPRAVFDLIVANPPYISTAEYEKLDPAIRDYEPASALLAGPDGLDCLRCIITQAEPYLADDAAIMVEIAYNQAEKVIALFEQSRYLTDITTVADHLGHQRVVKARKS